MIEVLVPRHRETHTEWVREFTWKDDPEAGFSFPCDSNGNLSSKMEQCAIDNYKFCLANPDKLTDEGVVKRQWDYIEPAKCRCECGEIIYLNGDTCCQNCYQWYNGFGQELLPPEMWEEDW